MNNSQINNIEWKDGAVCYADGEQWYVNGYIENKKYQLKNSKGDIKYSFYGIINYSKDLQLNEPRIGDYIRKSELDTEQKYNDAVEEFGFPRWEDCSFYECESEILLVDSDRDLTGQDDLCDECQRKITYNQLMAIGKLKRLMNERNNAVLSLDEETELKSRSMASELNSQSNDDEWPKVGDKASWDNNNYTGTVMAISEQYYAWCKLNNGVYHTVNLAELKKPKTPEDILSEELAKKGVQDVYILACQIINGEFDSIKYVPKNSV